jgi:hypothetical protein
MTDIILKSIRGANLNLDIIGFELKGVYKNISLGTIQDISNIDFQKYQASILENGLKNGLEDGLIDYVSNLNVSDNKKVIGTSAEPVTTLSEDEFNKTIKLFKAIILKRVEFYYANLFRKMKIDAAEHEKQTWAVQKEEAEKWKQDNNADIQFLPALAEKRGISLEELATKILKKTDSFNKAMAELLGEQKSLTDKVKSVDSIENLRKIDNEL